MREGRYEQSALLISDTYRSVCACDDKLLYTKIRHMSKHLSKSRSGSLQLGVQSVLQGSDV